MTAARRIPGAVRAARRAAAGAALLAGLASALAAQQTPDTARPALPRASWQDTFYLEAIIRIDIENGPSQVVPALTYNGTLMLPVRQFFELAEIRLAAFALRDSLVGILEPGAVPLRFRPDARLLVLGRDSVAYDTLDVTWWDGDLFVATRLFDRLLGISTKVEWSALSVTVGRSAGLPVVLRERRERRRQLMGTRRPSPEVLDLALRRRTVDGAVATWSLTAATRDGNEQTSLDLGFGASVLGGSAELRPILYSSPGVSEAELRWSWAKAWPEGRHLRQVRLGDVQTGGRRSRYTEGFVITSAPFVRSSEFDVEQLVTNVPAGWEAELYERGRLLAWSEGDALGVFRVPLQLGYGQNPYELVLYGPGGQTVRRARTVRVPFSRLPGGTFEYSVSGGRCRFEPCDGMLGGDARYGLSSRVTLQGGWDAFFGGAGGTLLQPYAIVSGAATNSLGLTAEAVVNGHLRASANYEPSIDLQASASITRFSVRGARFDGGLAETSRSEASVFWRPGWMRGMLILQGAGLVSSGLLQDRSLLRLSSTTRVGRFRYGLGILTDDLRTGTTSRRRFAVDASTDASLNGPWSWLRAATVQGQLAFEPSRGLTALRAGLGRAIGRRVRMDAGLGWLRGTGLTVELAFSTATRGPRLGVRSRVTSDAGSEALMYASGAVAIDPRTRLVRLSDAADLGRAGISGILFQDDNANGRQDDGEHGLAGIPIRVGGWPARTDDGGRFSAWGMFPSEPLLIDIDTLALGNPQLVLPAAVLRVRPAPNAFGDIAVPVVVGAEVGGYVVLEDAPVAGVPVILRDLNTGAELRTMTFHDGGFYRGAVPPGEYEVTLPDALLAQMRVTAPPLSIFVPPGAQEKRFDDLHLRLERVP